MCKNKLDCFESIDILVDELNGQLVAKDFEIDRLKDRIRELESEKECGLERWEDAVIQKREESHD